MSQQISNLIYKWEFIEFWLIQAFIRLERNNKQQNETKGVCALIMDFLRCNLCFIGAPNYDWYVNEDGMRKQIAQQNKLILDFAHKNVLQWKQDEKHSDIFLATYRNIKLYES